jgi:Na+/melibiose symporter-like transporter
MSNEEVFTDGFYLYKFKTPATLVQIIAGIVLGIAGFIAGNKFKKSNLGKIKILASTHVDGKRRRTALYASVDEQELNELKHQIETRIHQ